MTACLCSSFIFLHVSFNFSSFLFTQGAAIGPPHGHRGATGGANHQPDRPGSAGRGTRSKPCRTPVCRHHPLLAQSSKGEEGGLGGGPPEGEVQAGPSLEPARYVDRGARGSVAEEPHVCLNPMTKVFVLNYCQLLIEFLEAGQPWRCLLIESIYLDLF